MFYPWCRHDPRYCKALEHVMSCYFHVTRSSISSFLSPTLTSDTSEEILCYTIRFLRNSCWCFIFILKIRTYTFCTAHIFIHHLHNFIFCINADRHFCWDSTSTWISMVDLWIDWRCDSSETRIINEHGHSSWHSTRCHGSPVPDLVQDLNWVLSCVNLYHFETFINILYNNRRA